MPKVTTPTAARQSLRHNPLEQDLLATGILRTKSAKRKSRHGERDGDGLRDDDGDARGQTPGYVDARASRTILRIGRELLDEDEAEGQAGREARAAADPFGYESRIELAEEGARLGDDDDGDDDDEVWGDEDEVVEEIEVDPQDLETYRKFLPDEEDDLLKHGWDRRPAPGEEGQEPGTNLADLILQRIADHEAANAGRDGGMAVEEEEEAELPPKVVEVYTQVGHILSRYRSGKLPKPLKILPQIPRWEEIIQLCEPQRWTPQACYEATRLFVVAKPVIAQRFLEHVVLDKVRRDIADNRRLNVHLFNALRRSLFKASAFFKGFLFPLVTSGSCTLREAHIVSGVLSRVSVPVLHCAAAIKGLCDIAAQQASQGSEGGGATNVLIRTMLAKRLALPHQVVDALVFHFLRFRSVDPAAVRECDDVRDVGTGEASGPRARLPVIWHQCLLEFAQRYRNDITEDQREALLDLLLTHGHRVIGEEVRRELLAGRGRGIPVQQTEAAPDGDDTMMAG